MKLTPWYPSTVKPVRVGVYERDYNPGASLSAHYCYWNGEYWSVFGTNPEIAPWFKTQESPVQNLPWRGVAK